MLASQEPQPHVPQSIIEERLREYLGVNDIVWLNKGLAGDDTDGHVDNLVRFVDVRKAVYLHEHDRADKNYRTLLENRRILDGSGMFDELVALPTPGCVKADGRRLSASYANFYIANNVVLAPVFGKENDDKAVGILRELFPTRRVVPINCVDFIPSGGTIHCVTQQEPKGACSAEK